LGVQQRYPQYDIVGALRAGIENWNEVFGFKVFEASVASTSQSFADDDVNYFIYDEDPSNGFAFADWLRNGEGRRLAIGVERDAGRLRAPAGRDLHVGEIDFGGVQRDRCRRFRQDHIDRLATAKGFLLEIGREPE